MKSWLFVIICLLVTPLTENRLDAQNEKAIKQESVPPGWHIFDSRGNDPALELTCRVHGSDRQDSWVVSPGDDTVIIKRWGQKPALNGGLSDGLVRVNGKAGWETEQVVADGKLIGLDGGEFGGGLWFAPRGSSEQVQLSSENVMAILPVSGGALILTEYFHYPHNSGKLYFASENSGGKWALRLTVDLGAAPVAAVREGPTSFIAVTADRALRIDDSGNIQPLGTLPAYLRPNSVAIGKNGDIYIGMPFVVYRFRKTGKSYLPEALIPDSCNFLHRSAVDTDTFCSCNSDQ